MAAKTGQSRIGRPPMTRQWLRKCKCCGATKTLSHFYRIDERLNSSRTVCLECHEARAALRFLSLRSKDRGKKYRQNASRRHFYGLSPEDYEAMLASQDSKCAICGIAFDLSDSDSTDRARKPEVDHCHRTGLNRQLLCPACNKGLGFFNDDVEALRKSIAYIEYWRAEHERLLQIALMVERTACDDYADLSTSLNGL